MNVLGVPLSFVVYDLEWTAWPGSMERKWSGRGEYREIYDIGAVQVEGENFIITDTFHAFLQLELVEKLPHYSIELTGIQQIDLDTRGIRFQQALADFGTFVAGQPMYCWGSDHDVVEENCQLKNEISPFRPEQYRDIRPIFAQHGIATENYHSSTITEAFGQKNQGPMHQGVADATNIVRGLQLLQTQVAAI